MPVLLIHGIGADHQMWKPQIATLPLKGLFLVVPDLRGHGKSDIPDNFRISNCAEDLSRLMDERNIERAHLIGVSMGGMVVQQFTATWPERVLSQVIVDSLSGISRPVERFNANLASFLLRFFPARLQAAMIKSSYKKMEHGEVGFYFEDCIKRMDGRWLLMARQEVNRFSILDRLSAMHVPTLVLVGDGFGKLAVNMARTTAKGIPEAQFEILPGGGDPSNLLVPEAFDQAVLTFLSAHVHGE
jgi:3-oxoadipate enol-lactonase